MAVNSVHLRSTHYARSLNFSLGRREFFLWECLISIGSPPTPLKKVVLYQYRTGICAIYKGDPKEALEMLKAAYDKDPALENINFFLGRAYLLNEQFDEAMLQFTCSLPKKPMKQISSVCSNM